MRDNIVFIDNTSTDDNWIYNATKISVSVACRGQGGSFVVNLKPQEKKRITSYVNANVYPLGQHSYDDLIYKLGKKNTWKVNLENGKLILKKK